MFKYVTILFSYNYFLLLMPLFKNKILKYMNPYRNKK